MYLLPWMENQMWGCLIRKWWMWEGPKGQQRHPVANASISWKTHVTLHFTCRFLIPLCQLNKIITLFQIPVSFFPKKNKINNSPKTYTKEWSLHSRHLRVPRNSVFLFFLHFQGHSCDSSRSEENIVFFYVVWLGPPKTNDSENKDNIKFKIVLLSNLNGNTSSHA